MLRMVMIIRFNALMATLETWTVKCILAMLPEYTLIVELVFYTRLHAHIKISVHNNSLKLVYAHFRTSVHTNTLELVYYAR